MPDFSKGNWPKAAIGGLVLLNLALLSALALRHPSPTLAAVPTGPTSSTIAAPRTPTTTPASTARSPTPTAGPSDQTPTGTPTPSSAESPVDPVPSTRLIAVSSATLAWRASYGTCPTDPDLEVTRDGGRTWRSTSAGLRSVTRLRSYGESSVFAVGGTEDCKARYVATGGPGRAWIRNDAMLTQTWYRLPAQVNRVHAPSGQVSSPCGDQLDDVTGLGDNNAAAICADGTVRLTQDSGARWRDLEGVADGLALGADDNVYVLAMRKAGCDGPAVTLVDAAAEKVDSDAGRCADVDPVPSDQLAVGVRGRVLWLWAGDQVSVSTDRGRTWSKA